MEKLAFKEMESIPWKYKADSLSTHFNHTTMTEPARHTDGTGNAQIELGPFRIQEGGWLLTLYVSDSCEYVEYIEPPAYCSGCDKFFEVEISNVQCFTDNTWSFDIEVPSETTGGYYLDATNYDFNEIYTIDELDIAEGCLKYTLIEGMNCSSSFIICPPKPCSTTCNLEVYVEDVPCTKDEYDDITYYVDLEVLWPPSKYACYEATDVDGNSLWIIRSIVTPPNGGWSTG